MTLAILTASSILVDGADEPRRQRPQRLTGPDPSEFKIDELKDLCLDTALVEDSRANATIIKPGREKGVRSNLPERPGGCYAQIGPDPFFAGIYDAQAAAIAAAIGKLTGVEPPIATDQSPAGTVPIEENLIALGNRSTNATIAELYNRHFTLLDLRYPGTNGHIVRTLHNPFGNGRNVIFIGGSDVDGVEAATRQFIRRLHEADAASGQLTVGWIADITVDHPFAKTVNLREIPTWHDSITYKGVGRQFGWNSLVELMSLYYMTGEELFAREFIRLAFPDAKAVKELQELDRRSYLDHRDPLGSCDHYRAHMTSMYWDLIEESPVFSNEERLNVTNALARQIDSLNKARGGGNFYWTAPPAGFLPGRHGQMNALAFWCLGRYFQKDYPHPVPAQCLRKGEAAFKDLEQSPFFSGHEQTHWYPTYMEGCLDYVLWSGRREPLKGGAIQTLLDSLEIQCTGGFPHTALRSASPNYLHKAAYLTKDGRWIYYRGRTDADLSVFRLGQSFWPEEHLASKPPTDLVDRWSIYWLPEPRWKSRNSGLPLKHSFVYGSFRTHVDDAGDFVWIDGYTGLPSPYHTFAINQLRIDGYQVLRGRQNQVLVKVDGMVEPRRPLDAALRHHNVIGQTVTAVGETPKTAYCSWQRTLAHRIGRYSLFVDDLEFRADSENAEIRFIWEGPWSVWQADANAAVVQPYVRNSPERPQFVIAPADVVEAKTVRVAPMFQTQMSCLRPTREGRHLFFFSLIAREPKKEKPQRRDRRAASQKAEIAVGCLRLADHAAVLRALEPAVAVVGKYQGIEARLAILAGDHCYAQALRHVRLDTHTLMSADHPVHLDWDFTTGELQVDVLKPTRLSVALASGTDVRIDGEPATAKKDNERTVTFNLAEGRHVLSEARPAAVIQDTIEKQLAAYLDEGNARRATERIAKPPPRSLPALATVFSANLDEKIVDLEVADSGEGVRVLAAADEAIHVFDGQGKALRAIRADAKVQRLRWWKEHGLLLAGCLDQQVHAFSVDGERKWSFRSEDAVANPHGNWGRDGRGNEGIRGLYSGVFIDGKSQAFVGGPQTVEIINQNGQLLKRLPQQWGAVHLFQLIPRPDGTRDLLTARSPTAMIVLHAINSKTLDPSRTGFYSIPREYDEVRSFSANDRHHLFLEDMDGDGVREIAGEINGTWNRVTVWDLNGQARYNMNFGAGNAMPYRNMRDVDVADLDGDGKKEIVVGTAGGMIVALDCQCRKLWARRLASPPTMIRAFPARGPREAQILVGCEDGSVLALDDQGTPVRSARLTGSPTDIVALETGAAIIAILATDSGQIAGYRFQQP